MSKCHDPLRGIGFKFQSDSINTETAEYLEVTEEYSLNSNLILLILVSSSNASVQSAFFKFQSDSINTFQKKPCCLSAYYFKFQSDSINTLTRPFVPCFSFPLNSNLILLILNNYRSKS